MSRYQVNALFYYTGTAHVEAESQEKAQEKAECLKGSDFDIDYSDSTISSVEEVEE